MKWKPFTITALCLCGCDAIETHHVLAPDPIKAVNRLEKSIRFPGENMPQAGRRIRVTGVFRGHIRNLFQQ